MGSHGAIWLMTKRCAEVVTDLNSPIGQTAQKWGAAQTTLDQAEKQTTSALTNLPTRYRKQLQPDPAAGMAACFAAEYPMPDNLIMVETRQAIVLQIKI